MTVAAEVDIGSKCSYGAAEIGLSWICLAFISMPLMDYCVNVDLHAGVPGWHGAALGLAIGFQCCMLDMARSQLLHLSAAL
jgi:hypothetical protein